MSARCKKTLSFSALIVSILMSESLLDSAADVLVGHMMLKCGLSKRGHLNIANLIFLVMYTEHINTTTLKL